MKTTLLVGLVISAVGALSFAAFKPSRASVNPASNVQLTSMEMVQAPTVSHETQMAQELEAAREEQIQAKRAALKTYVLSAMTEWAPAKTQPDLDTSNYDSIASDIADVVLDDSEPPFWSDDTTKGRTAILVAAIGYWEGHYWKYVDQGRCNSSHWLGSRIGRATAGAQATCDGGNAYSIFQIHPDRGGIVLTTREVDTPDGPKEVGDGFRYHYDSPNEPFITGRDMIEDRRKAVRAALHILRPSVRANNNLCGYTGESSPCSKGKKRLDWANKWWTAHPFQGV